jgi:mannitol 2-dehydrogenase
MMGPVAISRRTLPLLPASIARPLYSPESVRAGIVHLGLGGFHRAHMARYTHDVMNLKAGALHWGILGAGLLPADRRMHDALSPQDGLYTLIERQGERESATVIGSICEVLFAGESSAAVVDAIAKPTTRIVSLTVTENGYCLTPAAKQLDFDHPAIVHDLANPELPRSAIGILVESQHRRLLAGLPATTVMSCDNIQHNGRVTQRAVLALARRRDPRLADWVAANATFPNTMVDRITPATTPENIDYLAARHGVADRWPVFSEMFRQWVIEERFVDGRPPWELVGAQFTDDVVPYEFMKLRLLNASHLAIAGLARLAGYTYVHEAVGDDALSAYMRALMDRETGPTLPCIPGVDLAAYKAQLLERFANPAIKDTVDRVNADAPLNLLVDPIRDRLDSGGDIELLALALAAWMRRVRAEDEAGAPIQVAHPLAEVLRARALAGGPDPRPLLAVESLFGSLSGSRILVNRLEQWLGSLYTVGVRATLALARQTLHF